MNISNQSVGYLTVKVSTARGAIPLEGATVNIRADEADDSSILYSLLSDRDGRTPKVTLSAPPKENSDAPGGASAFSTYNVDVFKEGYVPLYFHNVPIFPGVISVQPAVMVPVGGSSNGSYEENVNESPSTSLE